MNTLYDLYIGVALGFSLYWLLRPTTFINSKISFIFYIAGCITAGYFIAKRFGIQL